MDVNVRNEEDLLHFATGLSNLSQALVSSFSKANNEMNRVNEGWNDQQNQRFMAQFREATAANDKIARMMEDYSGYIRRYAQAVQQAKNVR